MAWFDLDGFVDELRARGVPEVQAPLYREAATVLLDGAGHGRFTAAMLDAALARERAAGSTTRRLDNLRRVGVEMVTFAGSSAATVLGAAPAPAGPLTMPLALELGFLDERGPAAGGGPRPRPAVAEPGPPPEPGDLLPDALATMRAQPLDIPLPVAVLPAPLDASTADIIDLAARPTASDADIIDLARPLTPRAAAPLDPRAAITRDPPPLPGCQCRARAALYADDYWQGFGQAFLGFIGVAGVALSLLGPRFLGMAASAALLTLGAIAAGISAGWRCEVCRGWIAGSALDDTQRRDVHQRRVRYAVLAVAFGVVLVVAVSAMRQALRDAGLDRRPIRAIGEDGVAEDGAVDP